MPAIGARQQRWTGSIVVRPSSIDGWLYALNARDFDGNERVTHEQMIQRLKGEEPESKATDFGKYLHEQLENGELAWLNSISLIDRDIDLLEPHVREYRTRRTYWVGDREVVLSGKVDAIHGRTIIDYKTTGKQIDLEQYHDAMQWRCYLALHPRCEVFRYEVFQWKGGRTSSVPAITDHRHIEFARYAGLEGEVQDVLAEYVRYLEALELDGHITLGPKGVLSSKEEERWRRG